MLDLGFINKTAKNIPLKPLCSSAKIKLFNSTSLLVQTDGSEEKGMTAKGYVVYDPYGSKLVWWGDIDFCTTSNEAEHYVIF